MRKYIHTLFAVTLVGLMAMNTSCNNEDEPLVKEAKGITTIYVNQPDTPQTRLEYGEYVSGTGISIGWEVFDNDVAAGNGEVFENGGGSYTREIFTGRR